MGLRGRLYLTGACSTEEVQRWAYSRRRRGYIRQLSHGNPTEARENGVKPENRQKRHFFILAGERTFSRGRYWDRTSDLFGVNEALSR